ncbi:MAG: NAD(P)-binding domain-containing protein, partial [Dehalococcoidia bacterium]|nr:NAD(P)-binding domain-containing protein [Dehalococcoidia bacterium]
MRIAFIGGGTMGEAMIGCLLNKNIAMPANIIVSDVRQSRRELLSREYGVSTLADNRKAIEGADLIILAVKPQDLAQAMEEIKKPAPQQVVLS